MQKHRRNRKRSQRRAIYCPVHGCYLESVSQKYWLYADKAEQLCNRGMRKRMALSMMASYTTVAIEGEWLEAFWCEECQQNEWYWISRMEGAIYSLSRISTNLWQQAQGVMITSGNPTVSEFTRRQSKRPNYQDAKDFSIA